MCNKHHRFFSIINIDNICNMIINYAINIHHNIPAKCHKERNPNEYLIDPKRLGLPSAF